MADPMFHACCSAASALLCWGCRAHVHVQPHYKLLILMASSPKSASERDCSCASSLSSFLLSSALMASGVLSLYAAMLILIFRASFSCFSLACKSTHNMMKLSDHGISQLLAVWESLPISKAKEGLSIVSTTTH